MKARPSRPSDSQLTKDCGLPDRVGTVGSTTPSAVMPLRTEKIWSAVEMKPSQITPVAMVRATKAAMAKPMTRAPRSPIQRDRSADA